MPKYVFVLLIFITSCSSLQECPKFEYNPSTKLTSLLNGETYTGRCLLYVNNSKRSIHKFVMGIDLGNGVFYFPNGKIEAKGKFKNGKRVGKWRYYYESGKLKQLSSYSQTGERSGKWIKYNENGEVINNVKY